MACVCKAAGVPLYSRQDLCHRRISLWHHQGINWAQIGAWAGQASKLGTANTYTHVLVDDDEMGRELIARDGTLSDLPGAEQVWPYLGPTPTVTLALADLTDDELFELICSILLLERYPSLVPTGGPGDRGRDAIVREALFGKEKVRLQYSLESPWTRKVRAELKRHNEDPDLPRRMIFVTSSRSKADKVEIIAEASAMDVQLQVIDKDWLILQLEGSRRDVAERLLHVAPDVRADSSRETSWLRVSAGRLPGSALNS